MKNIIRTVKPNLLLDSANIKLQSKLLTGVLYTEDYWPQVEVLLTNIFASGTLSLYNLSQLLTLEVKSVT